MRVAVVYLVLLLIPVILTAKNTGKIPSSDSAWKKLCQDCQKLEDGQFERFTVQYRRNSDTLMVYHTERQEHLRQYWAWYDYDMHGFLFPFYDLDRSDYSYTPINVYSNHFGIVRYGFSKVCSVRKTPNEDDRFLVGWEWEMVFMVGSTMVINRTHGVDVRTSCDSVKDTIYDPNFAKPLDQLLPPRIYNEAFLKRIPACFAHNGGCVYDIETNILLLQEHKRTLYSRFNITVYQHCIEKDTSINQEDRCIVFLEDRNTNQRYYVPDDLKISKNGSLPKHEVRFLVPLITEEDKFVKDRFAISRPMNIVKELCKSCKKLLKIKSGEIQHHLAISVNYLRSYRLYKADFKKPLDHGKYLFRKYHYPGLYYPVFKMDTNGKGKFENFLVEVGIRNENCFFRQVDLKDGYTGTYEKQVNMPNYTLDMKSTFMIGQYMIISPDLALDVMKIKKNSKDLVDKIDKVVPAAILQRLNFNFTRCFTGVFTCAYEIDDKSMDYIAFNVPMYKRYVPMYKRFGFYVYAECASIFDYRCVYMMYKENKFFYVSDDTVVSQIGPTPDEVRVLIPLLEKTDHFVNSKNPILTTSTSTTTTTVRTTTTARTTATVQFKSNKVSSSQESPANITAEPEDDDNIENDDDNDCENGKCKSQSKAGIWRASGILMAICSTFAIF